MAEFILFILIFVGIMAVSALIFGGWFLVMIIRGIAVCEIAADCSLTAHERIGDHFRRVAEYRKLVFDYV